MRRGQPRVFIIGPGGVGKTSSGPFLASKLGYIFVDLDTLFMTEIGNIGRYIENLGYGAYVRQNSELFFQMLADNEKGSVFALSSGFLIAETEFDVVAKNREAVKTNGISIMPLPDQNDIISANIVTKRQIHRGFGLKAETERPKFLSRVKAYRKIADYVVTYNGDPEAAANQMLEKIKRAG